MQTKTLYAFFLLTQIVHYSKVILLPTKTVTSKRSLPSSLSRPLRILFAGLSGAALTLPTSHVHPIRSDLHKELGGVFVFHMQPLTHDVLSCRILSIRLRFLYAKKGSGGTNGQLASNYSDHLCDHPRDDRPRLHHHDERPGYCAHVPGMCAHPHDGCRGHRYRDHPVSYRDDPRRFRPSYPQRAD